MLDLIREIGARMGRAMARSALGDGPEVDPLPWPGLDDAYA